MEEKSFSQYVDISLRDLPILAASTVYFSKKNYSLKMFSGHLEISFDNPAAKFPLIVGKKLHTFCQNFLPVLFPGHVEISFVNPSKKILLKVQNFLKKHWKM